MTFTGGDLGRIPQGGAQGAPAGQVDNTAPAEDAPLANQSFVADPDRAAPPPTEARSKKIASKFLNGIQIRLKAWSHNRAMNKISVQGTDRARFEPPTEAGVERRKHGVEADAHNRTKLDAFLDRNHSAAVTPFDFDALSDECTCIAMFGSARFAALSKIQDEDGTAVENLMYDLRDKPDVYAKLSMFLERGGSFETVSGVEIDHFSYDHGANVINLSANLVDGGDGELLCDLLDQHLGWVETDRGPTFIVGKADIALHEAEQVRITARKAEIAAARPTIDLNTPVIPIATTRALPQEQLQVTVAEAYRDAPNIGAVKDVILDAVSGYSFEFMTEVPVVPPAQNALVAAAMFGKADDIQMRDIDRMLANPELEMAVMNFVAGGGSFEVSNDYQQTDMVYDPVTNVISIPNDMMRSSQTARTDPPHWVDHLPVFLGIVDPTAQRPLTMGEQLQVLMFGGDTPVDPTVMDDIAADPNLTEAILDYLHDGGEFVITANRYTQSVQFSLDDGFIELPQALLAIDAPASGLHAALHNILDGYVSEVDDTTDDAAPSVTGSVAEEADDILTGEGDINPVTTDRPAAGGTDTVNTADMPNLWRDTEETAELERDNFGIARDQITRIEARIQRQLEEQGRARQLRGG